jgi:CBS domain containing-hemolysin-like protein
MAALGGPARWLAWPLRGLVTQLLRATNDRELTREEARLADARNRQLRLLPHVQDVERFVDEEAVEMIDSVRSFIESTAADVMTPRTEIEGVPIDLPREELIVRLRATNYSRLVVYERTLDTVVGSLLAKEVLLNPQTDPATFLRPPLLVPRATRLPELLRTMQQQRAHLAIVVDEYGGTAGLVTLHDLFEAILGAQIADEHDADEFWIQRQGDGTARLNGRVEVWEVNEDFDLELDEDEARTIGGYIARHLGRIPAAGDRLEVKDAILVVEEVSNNRVQSLRLERPARTAAVDPHAPEAASP